MSRGISRDGPPEVAAAKRQHTCLATARWLAQRANRRSQRHGILHTKHGGMSEEQNDSPCTHSRSPYARPSLLFDTRRCRTRHDGEVGGFDLRILQYTPMQIEKKSVAAG